MGTTTVAILEISLNTQGLFFCKVGYSRNGVPSQMLCTNSTRTSEDVVLKFVSNLVDWSLSREAYSRSSDPEYPRILRNPYIHNNVHKSQHLNPILSHMNPVYTLIPHISRSILILSWNKRLGLFENRVFMGIFGPKGDEMRGGWRKLRNGKLHNLYPSINIIRMIN
jgi:hypothetical protein